MLDSLITSKTRLKLLIKFFSNSRAKGYLRSLAKEFGESTNAIRIELNNLSKAGYLISEENGRKIHYSVNINHPFFPELQKVVLKYLGLDLIIEDVIKKVGDIECAFVTGDYANGKDTGIIDLVLVGEINKSQLERLVTKVERLIERKIRPLILSLDEFQRFKETLNSDEAIWLLKN